MGRGGGNSTLLSCCPFPVPKPSELISASTSKCTQIWFAQLSVNVRPTGHNMAQRMMYATRMFPHRPQMKLIQGAILVVVFLHIPDMRAPEWLREPCHTVGCWCIAYSFRVSCIRAHEFAMPMCHPANVHSQRLEGQALH